MNKGTIHQIIGPVIDIRFHPDEMPELLNAIEIPADGKNIVAEVHQHIGMMKPDALLYHLQTVFREEWKQLIPRTD